MRKEQSVTISMCIFMVPMYVDCKGSNIIGTVLNLSEIFNISVFSVYGHMGILIWYTHICWPYLRQGG